jgi:hypothetical protein
MEKRKKCSGKSQKEQQPMGRTGKGKIVDRGFKYRRVFVYIPSKVADDTAFPFQIGEDVTVTIEGKKLVIEKKGKR